MPPNFAATALSQSVLICYHCSSLCSCVQTSLPRTSFAAGFGLVTKMSNLKVVFFQKNFGAPDHIWGWVTAPLRRPHHQFAPGTSAPPVEFSVKYSAASYTTTPPHPGLRLQSVFGLRDPCDHASMSVVVSRQQFFPSKMNLD